MPLDHYHLHDYYVLGLYGMPFPDFCCMSLLLLCFRNVNYLFVDL